LQAIIAAVVAVGRARRRRGTHLVPSASQPGEDFTAPARAGVRLGPLTVCFPLPKRPSLPRALLTPLDHFTATTEAKLDSSWPQPGVIRRLLSPPWQRAQSRTGRLSAPRRFSFTLPNTDALGRSRWT